MNKLPKALLVDDHEMFCEAVSTLIKGSDIFSDVHYANNYIDSVSKLKSTNYRIALLDIEIKGSEKNGFDIAVWIKKNSPNTKIIMLSSYNFQYHIQKFHTLNLDGYVLKNAKYDQLFLAINTILKGEKYIHPEIEEILERVIENEKNQVRNSLTLRELEIIQLLFTDKSLDEISAILNISIDTLNKHMHHIREKTNTQKSAGIVKFAIENGLIK